MAGTRCVDVGGPERTGSHKTIAARLLHRAALDPSNIVATRDDPAVTFPGTRIEFFGIRARITR
jgi:hypothetical protein